MEVTEVERKKAEKGPNISKMFSHLPVILVTGYCREMSSSIEAALSICAYTCLYKPLETEKLFKLLNEIHHRELVTILNWQVRNKAR